MTAMARGWRGATRLVAVMVAGLAAVRAAPPQRVDPPLSQILAAAGAYVATYERGFGAMASEEYSEQSTNNLATGVGVRHRTTTSDVLTFNTGGSGWMVFRDVLEADGKPLMDHSRGLLAVVTNPSQAALADAMRRTLKSADFNIGSVTRGNTVPTAALTFLRLENQPHATFAFAGMKTIDKLSVALVTFAALDDQAATDEATSTTGRFWIEPESGRVVRTEIAQASKSCDAKIEVQYAAQPGVDMWVPVRMFEQYDVVIPARTVQPRGSQPTVDHVDGLATYRNFRRFETNAVLTIR